MSEVQSASNAFKDGIGDTIRVSASESPEEETPGKVDNALLGSRQRAHLPSDVCETKIDLLAMVDQVMKAVEGINIRQR